MRKLMLALCPIIALIGVLSATEVRAYDWELNIRYAGLTEVPKSVHHVVHHRHPHRHRHIRVRTTPLDKSGQWLRRQVQPDPGVQYNRARQWLHWGQYTDGPDLGTVGVLPDRVFVVVKVIDLHKVEGATSTDGDHIKVIITRTDHILGWRAPSDLTLAPDSLYW